jgi:Na+/glutamate symporter
VKLLVEVNNFHFGKNVGIGLAAGGLVSTILVVGPVAALFVRSGVTLSQTYNDCETKVLEKMTLSGK